MPADALGVVVAALEIVNGLWARGSSEERQRGSLAMGQLGSWAALGDPLATVSGTQLVIVSAVRWRCLVVQVPATRGDRKGSWVVAQVPAEERPEG